MRRIHLAASVFVSLGATSAFAAFVVSSLPREAAGVIILLVAAVQIWSTVYDASKKSALASVLASECSRLAMDWRRLWSELSSLSDEEALRRIQSLESREVEITSSVPHDLGIDSRLNQKCAMKAYRLIEHEYGAVQA